MCQHKVRILEHFRQHFTDEIVFDLFISSSTIGFIQSELIKELNRFQFHRFCRSIFGFPVSNGEQTFSSTLSLKRGVIRSSHILIRQLPILVDFGFLYFGFISVLASHDLHVLAEHQFPIQNLVPLEAFSNPAHQSTPNRDAVDRDESGRIDLDGILHSFDKSNISLGNTSHPPVTMATFQIPQEGDTVDITGDGLSGEDAHQTTTIDDVNNSVPESQSANVNVPTEERSGLFPFSMYLNLAQTPALDVQTQSVDKEDSCHTLPNTSAAPNYVTNSDLEALERRFQVMVSEATASFSSQLH